MSECYVTGGPFILKQLRKLKDAGKKVRIVRHYETMGYGSKCLFGDTDPHRIKYVYLNNVSVPRMWGPASTVDALISSGELNSDGLLPQKKGATK